MRSAPAVPREEHQAEMTARTLMVACTTCGAQPQFPCKTRAGTVSEYPHRNRVRTVVRQNLGAAK